MVDRFDGPPEMQPYPGGEYVRYSDYATLAAEVERLKAKNRELLDRCWRLNTRAEEASAAVKVAWTKLDEDGWASLEINGKRITTFPSWGQAEEVVGRILSALTTEPLPAEDSE